ncbi:MAG: protein kinase [Candidatus Aureabacteria bacterium]|nr:protein kinase [Candidatus Auribacterota bacterium]
MKKRITRFKKPSVPFDSKETRMEMPDNFIQENNIHLESSALEEYEIIRQIGSGAAGMVYEAIHKHLKRRVAIKVLKPHLCKNPVVLERFNREGATIAKLKHENIATIYDFVSKGDMHYIVMEYIEGTTLEELMRKAKKIPVQESVRIIMGVLRGLNIAHNNNIIHRDIKPSNIIINSKGNPILFDFGLAKLKDVAKNISNIPIGTPSYMAPEQFQEQLKHTISARTDFFSLGVMFYEMISGELPFLGNSFSVIMHKIINEEPLAPSKIDLHVPKDLDKIISKLLEKNADFRYNSAREILEDLDCFRQNLPLKHIKKWLWNSIKRFVYRFIKNKFFIVITILLSAFFLAYSIFTHIESRLERTKWKNVYTLASDSFLKKDWTFFNGFHERSQLTDVQRNQMIIPLKNESLIINTPQDIFGIYYLLNSSDVKADFTFQKIMKLDPNQPSRVGFFISSEKDRPSGYIFYITEGIAYFAKGFVENTVLEKPVPPETYIDNKINVTMFKKEAVITILINGKDFFSYQDFMPLSSPENGYAGFIGENLRMKIHSMKIFSLSLPQKTRPVLIGQKLMELGEYEKALAVYKDIVSDIQDKETVNSAHYQIGLIHFKLGEYEKAIKEFNNIISNTENVVLQSKCFYHKAMMYLQDKNIDLAKENFLKAKSTSPSRSSDLNILAGVFSYITANTIVNIEDAINHETILDFMLNNFPDYKFSFIHEPKEIALFYFRKKEYKRSRRMFQLISEEFSVKKDYCAWSYLMIGESYRMEGLPDLAWTAYDDVGKHFPNQKWLGAWALHRKAQILIEKGEKDKATKIFQHIINVYKPFMDIRYKDEGEDIYSNIVYRSYDEIQKLKSRF